MLPPVRCEERRAEALQQSAAEAETASLEERRRMLADAVEAELADNTQIARSLQQGVQLCRMQVCVRADSIWLSSEPAPGGRGWYWWWSASVMVRAWRRRAGTRKGGSGLSQEGDEEMRRMWR